MSSSLLKFVTKLKMAEHILPWMYYAHVYFHARTQTHIHTHTHTNIHTHTHALTYVSTRARTQERAHTTTQNRLLRGVSPNIYKSFFL